jgi:predicted lipoprotein with Yx(FWY)xxD motif
MAPSANEGGAAGGSTAGAPSQPDGDAGASPTSTECVYRLDVENAVGGVGGEGGSGGASDTPAGGEGGAAPLPTIAKATSRLIGDYLTDASGRALYVFGADLAGDCKAEPVSACEGDCLLSWPIFHAESRVLGLGVDAPAFGSFRRADGTAQTTY